MSQLLDVGIPGQIDILENIIACNFPIDSLLDIGLGKGHASRRFHEAGINVTATGLHVDHYSPDQVLEKTGVRVLEDVDVCDMSCFEDNSFDAVWCSHVLEHVMNTGTALSEIRRVLKDSGYLFVCVPPFKHRVVGGHVHPGWNIGILAYVLAANGFDASEGEFVRHGYNICGVVKSAKSDEYMKKLKFSAGDLDYLSEVGVLPKSLEISQGSNGDVSNLNWSWRITDLVQEKFSRLDNDSNWSPMPNLPSPAESNRLLKSVSNSVPKFDYRQMTPSQLVQKHLPRSGAYRTLEINIGSEDNYTPLLGPFNTDFESTILNFRPKRYEVEPSSDTDPVSDWPSQSIDYIYCHDLFTRTEAPATQLGFLHRVLRQKGLLLGSVTLFDPARPLAPYSFNISIWNRMLRRCGYTPRAYYAGIDVFSMREARANPDYTSVETPHSYSILNRLVDEKVGESKILERNLSKLLNCAVLFYCAERS